MGHTNSTANLSLPQFIGTDKPTWLGDVNGAFSAIDGYVGTNDAAVAAAASDASSAISQAAAAVNTANTANTTAGNASTAATAAVTAANQANALSNQIALRTGVLANLHTTDKTSIVNAINEVATAAGTTYDNTGSGLTATNVQDAIDEVVQGGGGGAPSLVDVTASITQDVAHDSFKAYTFGKLLLLIGGITASVNNSTKVLTLPASLTPAISASTNFCGCVGANGANAIPTMLRINTSGECFLVNVEAVAMSSNSYSIIIPIQ